MIKATQAYYACVSFVDAQVGRLLDALDHFKLTENTIIVLWSDHGYHLGDHLGVWQKRTLFEQSARAPLIIRAPDKAGNGQVCRRVVEFIDMYPSLTSLAKVDSPSGLPGRDLSPLLADPLMPWDGYAVTQVLQVLEVFGLIFILYGFPVPPLISFSLHKYLLLTKPA